MDPAAFTIKEPEQNNPLDSRPVSRKPRGHRLSGREVCEHEKSDRKSREMKQSAPVSGSPAGDRAPKKHENERESREHNRKDQRHKGRSGPEKRPVDLVRDAGREPKGRDTRSRDRKDGDPTMEREPRSCRPKERAPKEREKSRVPRSRPHSLTRKAIWGERGEDVCAPNHGILRDKAPDHTDAPWYVRMWIAAYMRYRGLNDNLAANVHYTGAEFKELTLSDMVELFMVKCGVKQREAEILGRDVWECVHLLPSTATQFGKVKKFADYVGEDAYRLHALMSRDSGISHRARSLWYWLKAIGKASLLSYQWIIFTAVVALCIYVYLVFQST